MIPPKMPKMMQVVSVKQNSGVRIVYNRLLGGWYVVRGPHQTPLNGRFDSKAEAAAWLKRHNKRNGNSDVRSPTSTRTEVRSPTRTSTSTEAETTGNITVTGGAGDGATTKVTIIKKNGAAAKAVVALRNKIRRGYGHGMPEDQSTAAERRIVYDYPQYFENDGGYIKVKVTGKRRARNPKRLTIPQQHQVKIAKKTLRMPEAAANYVGVGYKEARRILKEVAGYTDAQIRKAENATASEFKQHQKVRLQDLVRKFQGVANGLKHRILEADTAPKHKYLLGCLALMKVKANGKIIPINFDGAAYLAADLRNNLHAVGKDAIISNVKKPNPGTLKELGKLVQIDYITAKSHIENGETVRFWHKLGEVDGEHPTLYIDSDGFPIINGGGYDIWSVGIVN